MPGALVTLVLSLFPNFELFKYSVLDTEPFDLHVLGTPPAFVLSQDQTLHKIYEDL